MDESPFDSAKYVYELMVAAGSTPGPYSERRAAQIATRLVDIERQLARLDAALEKSLRDRSDLRVKLGRASLRTGASVAAVVADLRGHLRAVDREVDLLRRLVARARTSRESLSAELEALEGASQGAPQGASPP